MDLQQFWALYQARLTDWFVYNYSRYLNTIQNVENKLRSELAARYNALLKMISDNYTSLLTVILSYYSKTLTEIIGVRTSLTTLITNQIALTTSTLIAKIYLETQTRIASEAEIRADAVKGDKIVSMEAEAANEVLHYMITKEYLWAEALRPFLQEFEERTGQNWLKQMEWVIKDGGELLGRLAKEPEFFFGEFWKEGFIEYLLECLAYSLGSEETPLPPPATKHPPYPYDYLEDERYG